MRKHLLALGCGYSAKRVAGVLMKQGWAVSGSSRSEAGCDALRGMGITPWPFDGTAPIPAQAVDGVSHLLVSVPPGPDGDPSLRLHRDVLGASTTLEWTGVFSSSGVYGDAEGAWIDETFPAAPLTEGNRRRLEMEEAWLDFAPTSGISVQVFRLPGIYGPGRSPFARVRSGRARRILKPGQVFNRVHVDDIVAALLAAVEHPKAGPIFHISDGVPAPSADVLSYAAELLGMPPPPAVTVEEAGLPPMAFHFYQECKRLDISRVRTELGFVPKYSDYRVGLQAILAEESAGQASNHERQRKA